MLGFYYWADAFLETLRSAGLFLQWRPLVEFAPPPEFSYNIPFLDMLADGFWNMSVGNLITGTGLLFILVYKLVKFFVGLITGS